MVVIETGEREKKSGILFVCENCKSKFMAKRKEVKVTPPCMEFEYYMDCPVCDETCFSTDEY